VLLPDTDMADPDIVLEDDDEFMTPPAVDEDKHRLGPYPDEGNNNTYFKNKEWRASFQSTVTSYLRLYIFADKYNVRQLRDDIMTAFVAQVHACNWWPDPDEELIQFTYANLPTSSKFLRFFVVSAAYLWVPLPGEDCATKMRAMRAMHTDFAFDVSLVQGERLQNY
jgi:hypothetical protein